jgi:DNA-binding NtrC family response regulator
LSDYFLAAIGPARLAVEALSVLERHDWPGNVRELRRVLERAAFVSESECIEPQHVAAAIAFGDGRRASDAAHDGLIRATLAEVEGSYIRQVLQESEFNVTTSAQVLGLSPWALYRKLRSHGIELRGAERLAKSPRRA